MIGLGQRPHGQAVIKSCRVEASAHIDLRAAVASARQSARKSGAPVLSN